MVTFGRSGSNDGLEMLGSGYPTLSILHFFNIVQNAFDPPHLVAFFDGLGDTFQCSKIGQYKA